MAEALPFPTTQAEMQRYQSDPGIQFTGSEWRRAEAPTEAPPAPAAERRKGIEAQLEKVKSQLAEKQTQLGLAEAAGFGAGTGTEIPQALMEAGTETARTGELVLPEQPLEGATETFNALITGAGQTTTDFGSQDAFLRSMEDVMKDIQEGIGEAQETQQSALQKLLTRGEEREPMADVLKEQFEEFGITEQLKQLRGISARIGSLQDRINSLEGRRDAELEGIEARTGVSEPFKGRMRNEVNRKYDKQVADVSASLGAQTMTMEAMRGNINLARGLVGDTVDAMMYDTEQSRQDLTDFMTFNQSFIGGLKSDFRTYFSSLTDYWNTQAQFERQDYRDKLGLVTDAAAEGVDLGLTTSQLKEMSLAEVSETYSKQVSPMAAVEGAEAGELRTVAGVGVVRILPEGGYEVVVPSGPQLRTVEGRGVVSVTHDPQTGKMRFETVVPEGAVSSKATQEAKFILQELPRLKKAWDAVPNRYKGQFMGRVANLTRAEERSPEVANFMAARRTITQSVARIWETGRLSDQDREFYLRVMPSLATADEETLESNLESVKTGLENKMTDWTQQPDTGDVPVGDDYLDYVESLNIPEE